MMSFRDFCLAPKFENFACIVSDETDTSTETSAIKIGRFLTKEQHDIGEYLSKDLAWTKIEDFTNLHQRRYAQTGRFTDIKIQPDDSKKETTFKVGHYFFDTWTMNFSEKV